MSNDGVISLQKHQHDARAVLADFQRLLDEEPDCASDGCVVIMLNTGPDGKELNLRYLSSNMKRMEVVALMQAAQYHNLKRALG